MCRDINVLEIESIVSYFIDIMSILEFCNFVI